VCKHGGFCFAPPPCAASPLRPPPLLTRFLPLPARRLSPAALGAADARTDVKKPRRGGVP